MINNWIVPIKESESAKATLLCFHHAGGAASFFRKFSKYINNDVNLYSIQLPGREKRFTEKFIEDLEEIIEHLNRHFAIKNNNLFLFGHSLGALLAYEFSRSLCKHNIIAKHLIISGRNAPSYFSTFRISKLQNKELLEYLKEIGDIPKDLYHNSELLKIFLPIIKSDLKISDTYTYKGRANLPHPITVYLGNLDKSINLNTIDEWSYETSSTYEKVMFNGGHFYLTENLDEVMDNLNKLMNKYL
jgi:surfactin synthase thioesterase subunit